MRLQWTKRVAFVNLPLYLYLYLSISITLSGIVEYEGRGRR